MYEKPKAKTRAEKERARSFRLQPGQQWHRGARVRRGRK